MSGLGIDSATTVFYAFGVTCMSVYKKYKNLKYCNLQEKDS